MLKLENTIDLIASTLTSLAISNASEQAAEHVKVGSFYKAIEILKEINDDRVQVFIKALEELAKLEGDVEYWIECEKWCSIYR